ncbi:unnamed protein product [Cuscuta campestris]|uniref:Uncharacterized protein n=1 Tax=Cuscuta campestris TaxID=132261 RepID=A0A484L611_9ASTE|nr:unnamed protein product [Cuscuta campestris]
MAGRRTRRNPATSAQSTVRSDNPEQGMIVPVNGLETALNNVANMMANIMERLDKALPGPSGTRDIPPGQPRQVLRTASSPVLQELHDPEEVERERRAIDRRRAEELARNNKVNEGQAKDPSRIFGDGHKNPRGSVFERISCQKAHVSERLGKNPEKAPQGWIRPQASKVASSSREPRQRNDRGVSQVPVLSLRNLEEDEVQSQARVPAPRRLGPPVLEAGEFQDLREQIQEMQRKINKGRVFTTRTNTPLAPEIFAEPYLQGFKMPFVKRYDGESDPQEHINSYELEDYLGQTRIGRFGATKQPVKYDTQVGEVTAQLLRAEEKRPRVEVVGDIEEVELEPGTPGRLVRIGKDLGAELRSRVIAVLRRFRRVFAWSPADMPGLDHKIDVHRLNVLPEAKPAHRIIVLTNEPLASLSRSPAASAQMTKWSVFISQYNVELGPRPSIKGQALADFQVECTTREMTRAQVDTRMEKDWWIMCIDGSSGSRSSGSRSYYAIRFQFRVSNNEAEYEALINGLKILGKMGVSRVQVYSDSRLVVGQITGEFEAKEERMKRYRDLSLEMLGRFEFKLEHIPRAQNAEADVLSKLSAESPEYISRLATVEELVTPSLSNNEVIWVSADPPEWLDRLAKYIEDGEAPENTQEARLLRMRAPTYKVQDGVLYKRSYNGVLLRCLRATEAKALMEEIHEGICAAHQGPYSISRRAIIQGYFWPTMRKDCEEYVRKCLTCQQFQNIPGRPATNYTPISSVIPFSRWGIDLVGALPKGAGQARWIVVAIDYFTKFGVPKQIISDNGTQFEEAEFQDFLKTWGIQHTKVSVAYPQANGQVENVNRTIIDGIKKKLLSEGSKWVDELPRILWTYRTTPRRATGDTPFGLAYGFEARAPAEVVIPTRREMEYDPEVNEQNQAVELNFVEERRDEARIRAENYRRQVKSYFDSKVKPRAFQVGDYVLRKREKSQPTKGGKLAKKYEGPYIIKAVVRPGEVLKSHGVPVYFPGGKPGWTGRRRYRKAGHRIKPRELARTQPGHVVGLGWGDGEVAVHTTAEGKGNSEKKASHQRPAGKLLSGDCVSSVDEKCQDSQKKLPPWHR